MKKLVSIIVPSYNEEASLSEFHESISETISSLSQYDWEVLYVNDGSTDATQDVITALSNRYDYVSYVELSRNFGKEKAMLAGFDYAQGDCAIVMDADLQDPPSVIPQMLEQWENGYEDIYAKRRSRGKESRLRRRLSMMYYGILDRSTNMDVLQNVGDFRLLDRKCIDALKNLRESERYTKGLYCWIGFKKKEILFDRCDRKHGSSHWNISQLASLALDGITNYTTAPLRMATIMGFLTGMGAVVYLIWILVKVMIWGDPVAGFPTLICVILFLGSIQLISIGIMGEYIGRIFNESKQRPNYFVSNYHERQGACK